VAGWPGHLATKDPAVLLPRSTPQRLSALVLGAGLLAGCAGSDPSTIETPEPTATSTPATSAPAGAQPTSTLPAGVDQVVRVVVRGGRVVGDAQRVRVRLGSVVRLLVTSDVADEVHLHTYDETVDVAAGATATLTFTASIPGVIEVELEGAGLTLARLQIQ
jgi:hypothetical protein